MCRLECVLFQSSAFIIVNEIEAIPTMDQKDGEGGVEFSYVSVTRVNFLLATTAATPVSQGYRCLPLARCTATHPRSQQARLSVVSSYFLRISIFPFIYFLTSRADLKSASDGVKSRWLIRPRTFSEGLDFSLALFLIFSAIIRSLEVHFRPVLGKAGVGHEGRPPPHHDKHPPTRCPLPV